MNGVHKTRTKSIWETRIIQILGLTFWRKNQFKVDLSTLVSLIIMQDGIKVQDGKISKINKHAGWNKAVSVGKFHFLLVKFRVLTKIFQKLINLQDGIRLCRMDFFLKRIRFCCTIIQETRVHQERGTMYMYMYLF